MESMKYLGSIGFQQVDEEGRGGRIRDTFIWQKQ
jgi:hypothetical protein